MKKKYQNTDDFKAKLKKLTVFKKRKKEMLVSIFINEKQKNQILIIKKKVKLMLADKQ